MTVSQKRKLFPLLISCVGFAAAAQSEELRNWFGDPFLQLSTAIPNCAEPLGPRLTNKERLAQSHHRAERGTTCWLKGLCERPNAFEYDAAIAERIKAEWSHHPEFRASSIWLTVQGRVVYFEGCAKSKAFATELEKFGRSIPRVTQAVATISTNGNSRPAYRTMPAQSSLRQ